ncbi:hypothetical protein WJ14_09475 [Burkholderia cenocepacia]|nr:hypothetical protein WJ14_09475 [Burkholderia cenocepacia]
MVGRHAEQPEFRLPEALVETGVVGHDRMLADERGRFLHDFGRGWCRRDHVVRDAGERNDIGRDASAGIHQTLETVYDFPVA